MNDAAYDGCDSSRQAVIVNGFVCGNRTPLCRLCGRLDDLISEPTRAVGATVTAGNVIIIGLPKMAR